MDIIYFGNDWDAENKTSSHHMAEQLSKSHRVIYVECPGLRAPKGSGRDLKKLLVKIGKFLRGPRKIRENMYVFTLIQIPLHRYRLVRIINSYFVPTIISFVMTILRVKKPLLWFLVPHLSPLATRLKSKGVIYYCIDDYSALPGVDVGAITRMDNELSMTSDVVFVASDTLLEKKKQLNKNVFVSPHGVDFEHFNQVYTNQKLQSPSGVAGIAKPVIGFWGLIEEWIDLDLVKFIAERKPEWNFIFVGFVAVKDNPCDGMPNVHFLGQRHFSELPQYAKVFDVAILPYKLNQQVINSNPIKLREYLATGKPVVSVDFPQAHHYSDVVAIASSYEEFERYVEEAIAEKDKGAPVKRIASVKDETWESRSKAVLSTVANVLDL